MQLRRLLAFALSLASLTAPAADEKAPATTAIENIAPGWRGRETYRAVSDDEFVETFALAEPGKDFATYSEIRFRRKK